MFHSILIWGLRAVRNCIVTKEASLEDEDNESEFVDEDIENEMANEFEDEKSTEDFDKKVNDVTPKPININNI